MEWAEVGPNSLGEPMYTPVDTSGPFRPKHLPSKAFDTRPQPFSTDTANKDLNGDHADIRVLLEIGSNGEGTNGRDASPKEAAKKRLSSEIARGPVQVNLRGAAGGSDSGL